MYYEFFLNLVTCDMTAKVDHQLKLQKKGDNEEKL